MSSKHHISMTPIPDTIRATAEDVSDPEPQENGRPINIAILNAIANAGATCDDTTDTDTIASTDTDVKEPPNKLHVVKPAEQTKVEVKDIKLKQWPEDPKLVPYEDLVKPIKAIINKGYRLIRNDEKSFDYEGFEIGDNELGHFPSPKYRFTDKLLAYEKKVGGRNLIDVALNVLYLLGIENGRRAERQNQKPSYDVSQTLARYREANKDLRYRVDELEIRLELKEANPAASEEELKPLIEKKLLERRPARIQKCKEDLSLDPEKSSFEFSQKKRTPFKSLYEIASRIECDQAEWIRILRGHGWHYKEWLSACEKKKLKMQYTS
jgi:hypothetical protein